MTLFYRFLLAWTHLDLIIARSTGRNPDHIAVLEKDKEDYELALLLALLN